MATLLPRAVSTAAAAAVSGAQTAMKATAKTSTMMSRVASTGVRSFSSKVNEELTHFQVEVDADGVCVVTLDSPGAPVNTLNTNMMEDFEKVMVMIESDPSVKCAVIQSGKKDTFIAGADINQLDSVTTAAEATALSKAGQDSLNRLENLKKPVVCAVNGQALGGGLELVMACHYRIASTNKKTVMAVPEVQLGLLPGAGGTQRLPKLVGIQAALTMMTTGQNIKPDRAKRMGLVDAVADPHALLHAAKLAALGMADGSVKHKPKAKSFMNKALEDNPLGRKVLFDQATKLAMKKSGGNYPAIPYILECAQVGASEGMEKGLQVERERFGELCLTPESESLRSIFFGMTALKKNRFGKPEKPVETVGVLGAGLMGAGVAEVTAKKGIRTLMKDLNAEAVARGEKQILDDQNKKVKKRRMTVFERDSMMSNIVGLDDKSNWEAHFKDCDLVIEAVLEDLGLKHKVIKQFEEVLPEHAIFASNTSALPIRDIAKASKRPENVIGMHYFSPVPKMPLLEIIRHEGTSDEVAARCVDIGLKQGKTVIVVGDVPGFYVNRCIGPMTMEVMTLQTQGASLKQLDDAMTKFGFPVGPITLVDEVGMDVAYHVQETLAADLGVRMSGNGLEAMKELVDAGCLGRKTGKGMYVYKKGSKDKPENADAMAILKKYESPNKIEGLTETEIQERISSRFVNEAALCLQDGVISSPTDGDIGAVFGIGFPPFRGGPFRMVDNWEGGARGYVDMMNRYADKHGEQFSPAQILVDHANAGTKFHP